MKFKKLGSLSLAAMLAMTTLASCGGSEEQPAAEGEGTGEPKILIVNNGEEPGSINPGLAQGTHESWVIEHCFEGLYRKAVDGTVELGVAESMETTDGLTYTVKLKEGTLWSNGDPVIAEDFVYQWKWVLDPANAAEYSGMLYIFQGGEEFNSGTGTAEDVAIKAIDDRTIEFTLVNPMGYLEDYLTHYTFLPVNSKVATANPEWHIDAQEYVTNGPFTVTAWNHKESIELAKNANYYEADQIKLDGVKMLMIQDQITAWQNYTAGTLDINVDLPTDVLGQLIEQDFADLVIEPELSTYYYMPNTAVKPYNNVKVRQALAQSIDRVTLIDKITKGGQTPAYGLCPPGIPDLGDGGDYKENLGDLFAYDPENAKKLLEEGLAEEGMTLAEFKPLISYNTSEGHKKIAEAVQNMWKTNLGVDAQIENMEFQVLLDKRDSGEFQLARAGWIGDYVDPMTFLEMFVTGSSFNEGGWSNARYDELIQIARTSPDDKVRFDAYKEAETILMDEMAIIPFYFYTKAYTVQPYVTGVYKSVNRYPSFKFADIVK